MSCLPVHVLYIIDIQFVIKLLFLPIFERPQNENTCCYFGKKKVVKENNLVFLPKLFLIFFLLGNIPK